MHANELELPDPCLPGCPLVQESWEAAGVAIDTRLTDAGEPRPD